MGLGFPSRAGRAAAPPQKDGGCGVRKVVRVMYMTNHIPPDRAWFAVSEMDASVRELTFRDVAGLERPWR
jgi:hypothetical protein